MTTQGDCVEDNKETNSVQEEHDVSNRHMTWWRGAWWVRVDNGPHLRTARDRRRAWRAATRAAREARETEQEAKGEKWGKKERENQTKLCSENTLHIVLHLLQNATATTTAGAPTTAAAPAATAHPRWHGIEE